MSGINKEYKDRLFKFIFGREENKAWALSLYNAVNGTHYTDVDSIEITTVEDAVYMGMKNDVSFLISDTMNLYEQQSTFNPNMPLRILFYASQLYSAYLKKRSLTLYDEAIVPIPAPRCICFYNGEREIEEERELKLSDAFINNSEGDIEVRVKLININLNLNENLLEDCKPLGHYSWFVAEIKKNQKETGDLKFSVNKALDDMPDDFEIKSFLLINREEVELMCITEYNEAENARMLSAQCEARGRAEGRTEGRILTLRDLIKKGFITEEVGAQSAGLSLDEFKRCEALYN